MTEETKPAETPAAEERPWESAQPGDLWVLTLEIAGVNLDFGAVVTMDGDFVLKDAVYSGRPLSRHDRRIQPGSHPIWSEDHD